MSAHAADPRFFAILSRHFISSILPNLSRPALHTYAYLRTWCLGAAGAASEWVELRVRRVAEAIGRTERHVRRGLAELRAARLIEADPTWETLDDGTRAQRANRWRVLPEPGFPLLPPPPERMTPSRPPGTHDPVGSIPVPTRPVADPTVEAAIEAVVPEVVAAVHGWAEDLRHEAAARAAGTAETIAALEAGTLDRDEAAVWGAPGTAKAAASATALREALADAEADAKDAADTLALPAGGAVRHPRWWELAVSTIVHRAVRRLVDSGVRWRTAASSVADAPVDAIVRGILDRLVDT